MPSIAIFAVESARRGALERGARSAGTFVDGTSDLAALGRLLQRRAVDLVVAHGIEASDVGAMIRDHRSVAFCVLAEESEAADFILAGAAAVLPLEANVDALGAAVTLVGQGLRLLPGSVLDRLCALAGVEPEPPETDTPALTPREREVLAAMADGASNKVIARRLGISFHTAKFHVAAILAKLDAETRTEALARAARLGLVML